jgi:hypothetical protein
MHLVGSRVLEPSILKTLTGVQGSTASRAPSSRIPSYYHHYVAIAGEVASESFLFHPRAQAVRYLLHHSITGPLMAWVGGVFCSGRLSTVRVLTPHAF